MSPSATRALTYHDFLSANRGGNLFTFHILQRIGAVCAVAAHKLRLAPTHITLFNLVLTIGVPVLIIAWTAPAHSQSVPWWPVAIPAILLFQLSAGLDCTDGQLARGTGTGSTAGARIDILCDVVAQTAFLAAVATVAVTYSPDIPAWFIAGSAALWMVNLVTSVLQTGESARSIVASKNLIVEVAKLPRDWGFVVLAMPVLLLVQPKWMVWFLVLFTALNALFLMVSIAVSARDALRR